MIRLKSGTIRKAYVDGDVHVEGTSILRDCVLEPGARVYVSGPDVRLDGVLIRPGARVIDWETAEEIRGDAEGPIVLDPRLTACAWSVA